jgi:hypothetical protein
MNNHSLSRNIPEAIKREVRQRCGFGCVKCGNAIYQYEHFDPEYSDALEHTAVGITLLCGGCHDSKTRGFLSKETIIELNKNPKALTDGFSFGPFDIGVAHPEIIIGTVTMTETELIIRAFGDDILVITPPVYPEKNFKISATLKNNKGDIILRIVENEWQTLSENWDCTVEGSTITIRSKAGIIDLVLRVNPPNSIVIERLNMEHFGFKINCEKGKPLNIKNNGINLETSCATITDCKVGIDITRNGIGLGFGGSVNFINMQSWTD